MIHFNGKMNQSKGKQIKVGNAVYPYHLYQKAGSTHLRCFYRDESGKRKSITRVYRSEADEKLFIAKVKSKAKQLQSGAVKFFDLPPERKNILLYLNEKLPTLSDLEEFLEWKESRSFSEKLGLICEQYLLDKKNNKQVSFSYWDEERKNTERLMRSFSPEIKISEISYQKLNAWHSLEFGHLATTSRNNARDFLVRLWRWSQEKKLLGAGELAPTRITKAQTKKTRREILAFTSEEARLLIDNVNPIHLPWLILCGWNGLRSEEVSPKPKDTKRPLMGEDFLWKQGYVIVPAETSKVGQSRKIPIFPITEKYLKEIIPKKGVVCPLSPTRGTHSETARLGKLLQRGWIPNGLRNSFISYKGVEVGIGKVSIWSGNSEKVCRSNYIEPTTEEQGKEWFAL